jgi:predicted N-acetyltransferase YhbS
MVTIRNAVDEDIPSILDLYEVLVSAVSSSERESHTSEAQAKQVFDEIKNMRGHELLVAEENGFIVGTTVLLIVPNLSHNALPWAIIENVIVNEKYRRRGIGKLMMDYCRNRAKEAGCYKVQLLSNKKRTEAHEFYKSIGYQASAEGFRLYL